MRILKVNTIKIVLKRFRNCLALFLFLPFALASCKPRKNLASKPAILSNPLKLDITFVLNKLDYSYQFIFENKGTDTIFIAYPSLYSNSTFFRLFDKDNLVKNARCAKVNPQKDAWIELIPGKTEVVTGPMDLKQYFCAILDDDQLTYIYQGVYKLNSGAAGVFGFDIPPTPVRNIETISIVKELL